MAQDNTCILFILIALGSLILHITGLISVIIYIPIFLLSFFFKNFGKFLSYTDVWLDEDFTNNPKSSLVITMVLQGDLSLNELRNVFKKNVLEARSTLNPGKLRYPELQQFITTFICFRIWKKDPNFLLESHIREDCSDGAFNGGSFLDNVHQKYLNNPYHKHQSPWELILIRNVNSKIEDTNINSNCEQTSILVFRVHHVMADVKSVLKLLVECLGKKPLITAVPENIKKDFIRNKLKFAIGYPTNFIVEKVKFWRSIFQSYHHPWKNHFNFWKRSDPSSTLVVSFSPIIKMSDIKCVAKENNVKTSAVVLSIIAGSVTKFCGDNWGKKVVVSYPMPKSNHPEFLTNHLDMATIVLATDEKCAFKRLQKCNKEFVRVKVKQQARYISGNVILCGMQMYPLSRLFTNFPVPIVITNNAGDDEGFSVGNVKCIDFQMSVGTSHGLQGVLFCTMSYQDGLRIGVVANKSILQKEIVENLAKHIGLEFQLLMNIP